MKRLIFSREFILLLTALIVYCVLLVRNNVIFGTRYTAPFSQLTFCSYISSAAVLLFVLLLTLCSRQFSPSENGAMVIINASPIPAPVFKMLRYVAIAFAFLIAAALAVGICFAFYVMIFGFTEFGGLIISALGIIIPSALLLFGPAMLLGRKKPVMVYMLLVVILIMGAFGLSLPSFIDLFGSLAIKSFSVVGQDFSFPISFWIGRVILSVAGITLINISLGFQTKKAIRN